MHIQLQKKIDNDLFIYIKDIFKKITGIDDTESKIKLEYINNAYVKGKPIISDEEYDAIFKDFINPSLVGVKIDGDRKRKLPIPMYSLDKYKKYR